ncbi:MAG TPA: hypothetical protein VH397_15735 [Xanthobacteraceae bacterium]
MATIAAWSISTFAKPKVANKLDAAEASAPISPRDIMVTHKRLPIEAWDAF